MRFRNTIIFVTGGAGFIGSAVIRHLLDETEACVVNIDKLTYASNLDSIPRADAAGRRYRFAHVDICDGPALRRLFEQHHPQFVMNLAAESHVDRSIDAPAASLRPTWSELSRCCKRRCITAGASIQRSARDSVSTTSPPTKSTAHLVPMACSLRHRPMRRTRLMRQAKLRRITWCALGEKPTGFLRSWPTAPTITAIKLILDNHSAHISRETKAWLADQPVHRFEFTFTPNHGSWLNLVEGFFSKLARSVLRHIRVSSKQELKDRLMAAVDFFNRDPVVHTWTYKLDKAA